MTCHQSFDSFGILTHGGPRKCQKAPTNWQKKWPKLAKNGQNWPKTAKTVTKRPLTWPIEVMAPSLLWLLNPHTWGTKEMPKKRQKWPKLAKIGQNWPIEDMAPFFFTVLESSHIGDP